VSEQQTRRATPRTTDDDAGVAGLLSPRDAARLAGVSYSTVLRAVRSGRLPATRVGRVTLIAPDDVRQWSPGRAGNPAAAEAAPVAPPTADDTLAELATVLRMPVSEALMTTLVERLSAAFPGVPVTLRVLDAAGERLIPVAWMGRPVAPTLVLRQMGIDLVGVGSRLQPLAVPGSAPADPSCQSGFILGATVRDEGRIVGLITIGIAVATISAPPAGSTADLLAGAASFALLAWWRQERDREHVTRLERLADLGPEVAIVADSGRLVVANAAFRDRFGLGAEAVRAGTDLVALVAQYEAADDWDGSKRSVARRLRMALAERIAVTLPWTAAGPAGAGPSIRLEVIPGDDDDPTSVVRVHAGSPVRPSGPMQA
jgi:excisionase family DNA binding protein